MTEMWERFSFYGMRALLVSTWSPAAPTPDGSQGGGLGMTAATATAIYSVYLAMVYLLAMPGGWFGDRVWGAAQDRRHRRRRHHGRPPRARPARRRRPSSPASRWSRSAPVC